MRQKTKWKYLAILVGIFLVIAFYKFVTDSAPFPENLVPMRDACIQMSRKRSHVVTVFSNKNFGEVNVSCQPLTTKTKPSYKICLHDTRYDNTISQWFVELGAWEPHYLDNFETLMRQYDEMMLLDIGTNIGAYSLLAAAYGRHVVSVEPTCEHLILLRQSVVVNGFQERIKIVENAISDTYETLTSWHLFKGNPGGIQMTKYEGKGQLIKTIPISKLSEFLNMGKKVLMKIDCEGYELKAMSKAKDLFEKVDIPYILMEWLYHAKNNELVKLMVDFGYYAISHDGKMLDHNNPDWGMDVIWVHKTAILPKHLHRNFSMFGNSRLIKDVLGEV